MTPAERRQDPRYRAKILARDVRTEKRIRMRALLHYGNGQGLRCMCPGCTETNEEFLVIDHTDGKGAVHRRTTGCGTGSAFYRWLKRNNFPPGFRILCQNCNSAYGFRGYCPHNGRPEGYEANPALRNGARIVVQH